MEVVLLEARFCAVATYYLSRLGDHFALDIDSPVPAARMTTAPLILNLKWKMGTLQLKGNFFRVLQLKLILLRRTPSVLLTKSPISTESLLIQWISLHVFAEPKIIRKSMQINPKL